MEKGKDGPSLGVQMMLKALGIDPEMIGKVSGAVTSIAERMKRIEEKLDAVLKVMAEHERERTGDK